MAALLEAAVRLLDAEDVFRQLQDRLADQTWEAAVRPTESLMVPVTVGVDVVLTMDWCYDLASLIVRRPLSVVKLFQQLICQAVSVLSLLPPTSALHPSQVLVRLRPYNLVTVVASIRRADHLQAFTGILCSLTQPEKYVESARFTCDFCGEVRFGHYLAGQPPPSVITDCYQCGSSLREDVSCRLVSETRQGWLLPLEALESPLKRSTGRFQSLRVIFRGDQCRDLALGGRLCVVGVAVQKRQSESLLLEVLTARHVPLSIYAPPLPCALSTVIETLYHDRCFSPWSFALSLAYVFCSDAAPAGTYFRLKLGMLLSLVACGTLRHGRALPVLAAGPDISALLRLQQRGAAFSRRMVRHAAGGGLLCGSAARRAQTVELEAGSLLLARGGVCLLGDLSKCRRPALHQLQKCMELGSVPVDIPASSSTTSASVDTVRQPLLCQPWAVFDRLPTAAGDLNASLISDATSASAAGRITDLPRSLAEAFGMVYHTVSVDDSDDLASDLSVCQLLLRASGGRTEPQLITDTELQTFVAAAGELSLEMQPDSERLVRGYFVASRRVRTCHVPDVPTAALHTISGMAHAFAQLSLRSAVTPDDVTMAILLYEESLAACFGYSPLGVSHTPHVRRAQLDANLGRQNDERMREFQQILEDFIAEWSE